MGNSSSSGSVKSYHSRSDKVKCINTWRAGFAEDLLAHLLTGLVTSTAATGRSKVIAVPLVPRELAAIVASYCTANSVDMLECSGWFIAQCIKTIPVKRIRFMTDSVAYEMLQPSEWDDSPPPPPPSREVGDAQANADDANRTPTAVKKKVPVSVSRFEYDFTRLSSIKDDGTAVRVVRHFLFGPDSTQTLTAADGKAYSIPAPPVRVRILTRSEYGTVWNHTPPPGDKRPHQFIEYRTHYWLTPTHDVYGDGTGSDVQPAAPLPPDAIAVGVRTLHVTFTEAVMYRGQDKPQ